MLFYDYEEGTLTKHVSSINISMTNILQHYLQPDKHTQTASFPSCLKAIPTSLTQNYWIAIVKSSCLKFYRSTVLLFFYIMTNNGQCEMLNTENVSIYRWVSARKM